MERKSLTARFRTWFSRLSNAFTYNPGLPDQVAPSEHISRFILSRQQVKVSTGSIKHNAFMPPPSGRLSIYRTQDLSENEIWTIGTEFVATPQNKVIHARGDLMAGQILDIGLGIKSEPTPHPRHADVIKWPDEKDEQKMYAIELANAATLRHAPKQ